MNNQTAYLIKEREPEFPCWLYHAGNDMFPRGWNHSSEFIQKYAVSPYTTHWLPDSPDKPTLAPDAPKEEPTPGHFTKSVQAMVDAACDEELKAIDAAPQEGAPTPDTSVEGTIENFLGMAKVADAFNDTDGSAKEYRARAEAITQLRASLLAAEQKVGELEKERDALKVEYESRALWIEKMNKILGYDNSDGFHSQPDPHEIAARLRASIVEAQRERDELAKHYRTAFGHDWDNRKNINGVGL